MFPKYSHSVHQICPACIPTLLKMSTVCLTKKIGTISPSDTNIYMTSHGEYIPSQKSRVWVLAVCAHLFSWLFDYNYNMRKGDRSFK